MSRPVPTLPDPHGPVPGQGLWPGAPTWVQVAIAVLIVGLTSAPLVYLIVFVR